MTLQLHLTMLLFLFLFGACVGSFLNVVIWRLPRDQSLMFPGSHCPKCNTPLTPDAVFCIKCGFDLRSMEQIVRESGLAWTIARPPRLTQSSEASFLAVPDALPVGSRSMSFRSLAAFMLDAIERRSHVAEIVGLGRPVEAAS